MTTALHIRRYADPDQSALAQMILLIQNDEFGLGITLDDQPDLQDVDAFYGRGEGGFWVATRAGEIVGSIGLLDIGAGQAALRKMFIAAAHRGGKPAIAAELLEVAIAHCRDKGIHTLLLGTTERFLAAHRFYEKHGFVQIPRQALPATFPVMAVDKRFYRRDLAAGVIA